MTEQVLPKAKKSVALSGTAAGNTAICTVGSTGNDLHYRGYDILDFAEVAEFEETAHLLIHGHLPTQAEYERFSRQLTENANLDEDMKHHFAGFPRSAPPMAILSAIISTLSCFHPQLLDLHTPDQFEQAANFCTAAFKVHPIILVIACRARFKCA